MVSIVTLSLRNGKFQAFMQTNTQQYKQQQQAAQAPPKPAGAKGRSGAFDNLLDGFGSNFGQKAAAKNQKMGDLKVILDMILFLGVMSRCDSVTSAPKPMNPDLLKSE